MKKVNHPNHYNLPGKKECIEQMLEDYGFYITMMFCLTNAYKYLYRAGEKLGESFQEDIQKARWYYDYCMKLDQRYRNRWIGHDYALRKDVEKMLKEKEARND